MKTVDYREIGAFVESNQQVEQISTVYLEGYKWTRIGEFPNVNWGFVTLALMNDSSAMVGRTLMIAFSSSSNGNLTILHKTDSVLLSKFRMVVISGIAYLEVYTNTSISLRYKIIASSIYRFKLYDTAVDGNTSSGTVVEFPVT